MQFELLPPVPAVVLARKLRQIPLFRFVSVDELFRIATISMQARYEENATVQEKGTSVDQIQVLLEGTLALSGGAGAERSLDPPSMLGFREVLEGTTARERARATSEAILLVMPAEEFRTLLAANIELAQGLFRMLLERNPNGTGFDVSKRSNAIPYEAGAGPLHDVDKVLHLQTIPILSRATAEELTAVAAISREVDLKPDETLFSEGEPSSIFLVLSGELALESSEGKETVSVGEGQCFGIVPTLAGSDWAFKGAATKAGKALQLGREPLFDLLEDRMDLLQSIFGAIFQPST